MSRMLKSLVAITIAGGLALAGCGGDDDSGVDASGSASAKSGDGEAKADAEASAEVGQLSQARCAELAQRMARAASAANPAGSEDLDESLEAFRAASKQIPSEIRADWELMVEAMEFYAELATSMKSGNPDPAKLEEAASKFDTAEFEAASARLEKYFEKCES